MSKFHWLLMAFRINGLFCIVNRKCSMYSFYSVCNAKFEIFCLVSKSGSVIDNGFVRMLFRHSQDVSCMYFVLLGYEVVVEFPGVLLIVCFTVRRGWV